MNFGLNYYLLYLYFRFRLKNIDWLLLDTILSTITTFRDSRKLLFSI